MRTDALLSILLDFHRDKLALRQRHVAVARHVFGYDANNTYQYVINREDVHLQWLEAAIAELEGTPEEVAEPPVPRLVRNEQFTSLSVKDAEDLAAFVDKWRLRKDEVTHARHRSLIDVILGETLEQQRSFAQVAEGREDVLGRRANGPGSPGTGDGVLGVRWIE